MRVTLPGLQDYPCDLSPVREYVELPERGGSVTISFEGSLGMRQLKTIEQHRTSDVTLNLKLTGDWQPTRWRERARLRPATTANSGQSLHMVSTRGAAPRG